MACSPHELRKRCRQTQAEDNESFKRQKAPRVLKIEIKHPGGYEVLETKSISCEAEYSESANIAVDQLDESTLVSVAVHAAGVNYADVCVRWGLYASAKKFVGWPITPGLEFSGVVESVGSNVKDFKPGDRVFGGTLFGAYSCRLRVPERQLFHLPDDFSMNAAASFTAVALTAWYALFNLAHPRPGQTILVKIITAVLKVDNY